MNSQQTSRGTLATRCLLGSLVLIFLPLITQGAILSPSEIVNLWIQVFPKDLKAAAALTTKDLRKGKNENQWVEAHQKSVADSKFHYLGGKVISETIDHDAAVVVFQAHFTSVLGEQIGEEVYHLKKQLDGGWLIDAVEMKQDHILGHEL